MTISDALQGLVGLYLLWAQNQAFRRQNDIFAIQGGSEPLMPDKFLGSGIKRYWPLLAMVVLVSAQWVWLYVKNQKQAPSESADSSLAIWILGAGLVGMVAHTLWANWADKRAILRMAEAKKRIPQTPPRVQSKLQIVSAVYMVPTGEGEQYDVADCLRHMVCGNSLVIDVENHSFVVGDRNYVPEDPKKDFKKWLRVEYRYGTRLETTTIERIEGTRMVLPEDTFVKALLFEAESQLSGFSPLQMKAFRLARDLANFHRDAMSSHPGDIDPSKESLEVVHMHSDKRIEWRKRVQSGYERRFTKEIDGLILEFGEVGIQLPLSFFPPGNVKKIEFDIPCMVAAIVAMAHRVDGVVFYGRQ